MLTKEDNCAHCGESFGGRGYYELTGRSRSGSSYRRINRRYCVKCAIFVMDILRSFDCFLMKEILR